LSARKDISEEDKLCLSLKIKEMRLEKLLKFEQHYKGQLSDSTLRQINLAKALLEMSLKKRPHIFVDADFESKEKEVVDNPKQEFDLGGGLSSTMVPEEIQLNKNDNIIIEPTTNELEQQRRLMFYEKWLEDNEESASRETVVAIRQSLIKQKLRMLQDFLGHYENQMSAITYKNVQASISHLNEMLRNGKLQEVKSDTYENEPKPSAHSECYKAVDESKKKSSRKWITRAAWYLMGLPFAFVLLGYLNAMANGQMTAVLLENKKLLEGFMIGAIAGSLCTAYYLLQAVLVSLGKKFAIFKNFVQFKSGVLGSQSSYIVAHPFMLVVLLFYFVCYVAVFIICIIGFVWIYIGSVLLIKLFSGLFQ
ncbi:MAG: hypothetical protein J5746_00885, partial [Victivallales bacterium]|nr:hypothetical protein [Victivallales bacterium]